MVVDRIDADVKLSSDLLVCKAGFYKLYYLDLPFRDMEAFDYLIGKSALVLFYLFILLLASLLLIIDGDKEEYQKHYEIKQSHKREDGGGKGREKE